MSDDAAARWQRVETLLEEALARAPAERDAFLDAACAGDDGLRREVASLLAAHERPGAVDRLGADLAPLAARVRGSATSARPALQGQVVGRYEVLEPIGGGGMGVVHRALDTRLGRTVALKFLQPRLDADDSAAERFRLEARAAAALEHPNICTVHEIGETAEGRLFLAMPLYDGETVERRIARGPLPVEDAVAIAVQVARGLAKAHAQGIVHRDVKPSNVLVTSDGVVKLLDFGIAKLADVTLTGGAGPLGTAAYMSPEQRSGGPVDHRTDLWSLGVVLHEMLAGRRPLDPGAETQAWPPPVSALRPDAPPALDRIVATALARDPARRYASAQAMERDLLALGVAVSGPGAATPAPDARAAGRRRVRRRVALAAGVAVALLGGAAWLGARRWRASEPPAASVAAMPSTIAVLPFADRSAAAGQAYFSDGMTEELIATLARVEGLRVASRTSSFAFRDRGLDVRAVGARLGVAAVLEGSVRRDGDRLRITAQLVSVADGWQLWSETYDRAADDAFAVQQEIASAIVQTLRGRLVGGVADANAPGRPDAAAYDLYLKGRHALYLKGRYAWYSRTEEGLRSAASYFAQAVAQAPGYARAHAGLADAYAVLGFYDFLPPGEAFPKADSAARRAAQLDPTLGGPHATLGYVALYHGWDFARAEAEFRRAIALEPNYSTAHQWYANLLVAAGRFDEAERAMRRAEEIDPLSLIAKAALAWVHYHAGDNAAAVAQARETLELDPDYAVAHLWGGWALQAMDSLDAAVAAHRRAVAVTDGAALYVASLARSLALAGERAEAERLLAGLGSRTDGGRYVPSYEVAKVHLALGRADEALAWLERALDERSHSMAFLRVDPQLAPLRADPRFARLVGRVFGP